MSLMKRFNDIGFEDLMLLTFSTGVFDFGFDEFEDRIR